ncbi:MAG: bacterioferritin [Rickettsiales bacterium]
MSKIVDDSILNKFNIILGNQLIAINQHFLHARILKYMGFMKLADYEYKESIQQMKYADALVEKILLLGGIPNLQEIGEYKVGKDSEDILRCDLQTIEKTKNDLINFIELQNSANHNHGLDILKNILINANERANFIKSQLKDIEEYGVKQYLAS